MPLNCILCGRKYLKKDWRDHLRRDHRIPEEFIDKYKFFVIRRSDTNIPVIEDSKCPSCGSTISPKILYWRQDGPEEEVNKVRRLYHLPLLLTGYCPKCGQLVFIRKTYLIKEGDQVTEMKKSESDL